MVKIFKGKSMYHHKPNQKPRKQLRLKDYDYSKKGLYFITISVKDKLCLFGDIKDDSLELFEGGKNIEKYWLELENTFKNIKLHNYVVMPNHFHGIIEIVQQDKNCDCKICRGAPCRYPEGEIGYYESQKHGYPEGKIQSPEGKTKQQNMEDNSQGPHKECPYNKNILGNIIGGFKSKTTNAYIKLVHEGKANPFNKKLWQRNFYEHIIRDKKGYIQISEYIEQNILKWEEDTFYYTEI